MENGLWNQTDGYPGICAPHMSCASLGEFLDLSEPFCQHHQAEGLPED